MPEYVVAGTASIRADRKVNGRWQQVLKHSKSRVEVEGCPPLRAAYTVKRRAGRIWFKLSADDGHDLYEEFWSDPAACRAKLVGTRLKTGRAWVRYLNAGLKLKSDRKVAKPSASSGQRSRQYTARRRLVPLRGRASPYASASSTGISASWPASSVMGQLPRHPLALGT